MCCGGGAPPLLRFRRMKKRHRSRGRWRFCLQRGLPGLEGEATRYASDLLQYKIMSIKRQALFLDIILCCSWHKFLEARRLVTAWWWNTRSDLAPAARAAAILLWRPVRSRLRAAEARALATLLFHESVDCKIALVCESALQNRTCLCIFKKQVRFHSRFQ